MRKHAYKRRKLSKSFIQSFLRSFKQFRLHHRVLFYFLGSFGVICMWKGFGALIDQTPLLSHPLASLGVGVSLAALGGWAIERS